jgi:hypothetical protein
MMEVSTSEATLGALPSSLPVPKAPSATTKLLLGAIHLYQSARAGRPTGCRYLPSCSEYACQALEEHGPVRGSGMTIRRLTRCTPWGGHGFDPVPDRRAQ